MTQARARRFLARAENPCVAYRFGSDDRIRFRPSWVARLARWALAVLPWVTGPALAEEPPQATLHVRYVAENPFEGWLRIRVVHRGNGFERPLSYVLASLSAEDAKDGDEVQIFTTNRLGEIVVTDLEPGSYELRVETLGYQTAILRDIRVLHGRIVDVSIPMREASVEGGLLSPRRR